MWGQANSYVLSEKTPSSMPTDLEFHHSSLHSSYWNKMFQHPKPFNSWVCQAFSEHIKRVIRAEILGNIAAIVTIPNSRNVPIESELHKQINKQYQRGCREDTEMAADQDEQSTRGHEVMPDHWVTCLMSKDLNDLTLARRPSVTQSRTRRSVLLDQIIPRLKGALVILKKLDSHQTLQSAFVKRRWEEQISST